MKTHTVALIVLIFIFIEALGAGGEVIKKRTLRLDFKNQLVLEAGSVTGIDRRAIFKQVADIYSFTGKNGHVRENMVMTTSYHEYMEDYYMVPVLNKEICSASKLVYRLHFYNPESKKHRTVLIGEKPVKITNDELNAFRDLHKSRYDSLIFHQNRPFFQGLLSDEKGRIYVIRTTPISAVDKKNRTLDVFDCQGNFLFRCHIPCMPLLIHSGRIYHVPKIKGKPSQLRLLKIIDYEKIPY
jgi:hypothetical protein